MLLTLLIILGVTLSILILLQLSRYYRKRYILNKWMNKYGLHQHEKLFQKLYQKVDGFALSKEARLQGDALEYLYGEIEFLSFIALMNLARPNPESVFYDLGSGTGKAVIACAMVYEMKKYVGIELFKELYQASLVQKKKLSLIDPYREKAERVVFINENFLNYSFKDGSIIFINATAFIGDTWDELRNLLVETSLGTIIITITKQLKDEYNFSLIHQTLLQMSWGVVTAYIYEHV